MLLDLHQEGIACLLQGQEDKALQALNKCMELSQRWISCAYCGPVATSEQRLHAEKNARRIICLHPVSLENVLFSSSSRSQEEPQDADKESSSTSTSESTVAQQQQQQQFQPYRFIFQIEGLEYIPDQATLYQVVGIITFNLAMVHHEIALFQQCESSLSKAISFYKLVDYMLGRDLGQQGKLDTTPVHLALYNNLGHICVGLLEDYHNAVLYRERIVVLLATMEPESLREPTYDFFLRKWGMCNKYRGLFISTAVAA